MVKPGKSKKPTKNGELQDELARDLKHLRTVVREIGENFILRREGEVEALIANLASVPPGKLRTVASDLLGGLHNLKLKPEKGRLKDLKELDQLIGAMAERVMTAQYCGKTTRKNSDVKKP
jgi:hypothetical protein